MSTDDFTTRPSVPQPGIAIPADKYLTSQQVQQVQELQKIAAKVEDLADRVHASRLAIRDAMIADIDAAKAKIADGGDPVRSVSGAEERKARSADAKLRAAWNAAAAVLRQEYTKFEQELRGRIDDLVAIAEQKAGESGKRQAELANAYMAARPEYLDDLDHWQAMILLRSHVQWRAANTDPAGWTGAYELPDRSEVWYPPERSQILSTHGRRLSLLESTQLPELLKSDSSRHVRPEPPKPKVVHRGTNWESTTERWDGENAEHLPARVRQSRGIA